MSDTIKVLCVGCGKGADYVPQLEARIKQLEREKAEAFDRGILVAASDIMRLWGDSTQAEYLLNSINVTSRTLKDYDMCDHDVLILKQLLSRIEKEQNDEH